jgi:hypothetical protein
MQKGEDNIIHTIVFDRQKLQGAKLNYPTQEKELLAVKEALHTWDQYIKNGTTTTVITNHKSLQYLNTTKKYSKQLARWVAEFQLYDLKIHYQQGKDAIIPDTISQ